MTLRCLGTASLFIVAGALGSTTAHAGNPTTADCLAANQEAVHLHNAHKLRAARQQLLVCASDTCPADIRTDCASRAAEISKAIPTVVFEVKDAAGSDLTAVKITMDGETLVDRIEGTAISLDPGEHTFTFEASGQPTIEKKLVVVEGVTERHVEVTLGQPPAAPPPPVVPAPAATTAAAPTSSDMSATSLDSRDTGTPPSNGASSMKTWGLVLGGVGLAGIVVGSIFGVEAFSKWSTAQSECQTATNCANHPQALSDRDSASTAGTISTVAFVGGGIAAAAGAALFLMAPKSAGQAVGLSPSVGPDGLGMRLKGVF